MEVIRFKNDSGYTRFKCPACEFTSSRSTSVVDHAKYAHGVAIEGVKPRPRVPQAARRAAPVTNIGEVPETVLVTVSSQNDEQESFRMFGEPYVKVRDTVLAALKGELVPKPTSKKEKA